MNYKKASEKIESWIKEKCKGFFGVVIGLSGGIDSTVSSMLAVRALGKESVFGLIMPNKDILSTNTVDAIYYATHHLGINMKVLDISHVTEPFIAGVPRFNQWRDKMTHGNIAARARMVYLYGFANAMNRLVLGTTNKTEVELGYYTKWGDGAVDIEPIADLYKCEVRGMAKYLGIPSVFIDKVPSAELWPGQTDEDEIGCTYDEMDRFLMGKWAKTETRDKIGKLREISEHKRVMPPHCELR